jgi:hypothetical protein
MDAYEELKGFIDALNAAGVDYALCGGLAVVVYGYVRATKDIDLLVRSEDLEAVKAIAEKSGFTIESGWITFQTGTDQEQSIYRLLKVMGEDILMLDLILVGPLFEEIWKGRGIVQWENRPMQIVSREGLMKMKKRAGRSQDLADLDALGRMKNEPRNGKDRG